MRTVMCVRHFLPSSSLLTRTPKDFVPRLVVRRFADISPQVVQRISRKVKQHGKLVVDLPCNVEVRSTDPHEYPDMDTLIVKLIFTKKDTREENADFLSIDVKDDRCEITGSEGKKIDSPGDAKCLIESPIQYDVDARTVGDSGIKISSMVSDRINLETERGDISGGKLQAKRIILNSSQGGSVDLRQSLQGDIEIKTAKDGSISAEKCLGTRLEMTTESGDISLGSSYCEKSQFTTVNGNLNLHNLHMDATVDISGKGALNISCLDGSLQAKLRDGEAKVQLVRLTGKSRIETAGAVHLVVPRENNVRLNLKGSQLNIDEGSSARGSRSDDQQVFESSGEIPLHVETSGSLRVTSASWAESLKLGNFLK